MDNGGAIGILAIIVLAVVGVAVVGGATLYATDYALKADVQDKQCGGSLNVISVKTRAFGIEHDVAGVPHHECGLIQVGDEVRYHIRTKQTTVYRDGDCFYDSVSGPACGSGVIGLL